MWRTSIPEIAALTAVFGALGCAETGALAGESPRTAEISFTIASGGFGAPPESITATRRENKFTLRIDRDAIGDGKPASETANLTPQEFERVWEVVTRNRLDRFKPRELPGVAHDFGKRTLNISTDPGGGKGARTFRCEWEKPLVNQAVVRPLIQELGKLSRSHFKRVQPIFFP